MTDDDETRPPTDPVVQYWEAVQAKAKIARARAIAAAGVSGTIPPPAFAFGDTPELADELLDLVLSGRKVATASALAEFSETDPVPRVGDLWIVLDGRGNPRALVRTTQVTQAAFRDVTAAHASAEGEGDGSLEHWRTEHEVYWRRVLGDDAFDPEMQVVLERFEVVDPSPRRTATT